MAPMSCRNGVFTHAFSESSSKAYEKNGLARRDTDDRQRVHAYKRGQWVVFRPEQVRLATGNLIVAHQKLSVFATFGKWPQVARSKMNIDGFEPEDA